MRTVRYKGFSIERGSGLGGRFYCQIRDRGEFIAGFNSDVSADEALTLAKWFLDDYVAEEDAE